MDLPIKESAKDREITPLNNINDIYLMKTIDTKNRGEN